MHRGLQPAGDAGSVSPRLRIVVLGYIIRGPLGGLTWHHLQYAIGLQKLGHDVWFMEDSDDYAGCYNPLTGSLDEDPTYGLDYAARVFERVGLGHRWAYFDAHRGQWHGPAWQDAPTIASTADVVINASGVNPPRSWWERADARVLIDTDPVFTQVRHLTDQRARDAAAAHTDFFSFGENFGRAGCTIPDDGLPWQPTRQPVVADLWPLVPPNPLGRYTTVMQWESYRPVTWGTQSFGMKADSFEPFADLPSEVPVGLALELALGSEHAPRAQLRERGWQVSDPIAATLDPWIFQRFIGSSRAEFAVAKQGYVASRSGWFSERTTSYLASGRPALAHDTGFSEFISADLGLIAFSNLDDVLEGIANIEAHYALHCRHAREIVEENFQATVVLDFLLQRLK